MVDLRNIYTIPCNGNIEKPLMRFPSKKYLSNSNRETWFGIVSDFPFFMLDFHPSSHFMFFLLEVDVFAKTLRSEVPWKQLLIASKPRLEDIHILPVSY